MTPSNVADQITITITAAELDLLTRAVERERYHAPNVQDMVLADHLAERLAGIQRALGRPAAR